MSCGRSDQLANDEQRTALESLGVSRDRGEADRAPAVLLTLNGWTSARIAEVSESIADTTDLSVGLWPTLADAWRGNGSGLAPKMLPVSLFYEKPQPRAVKHKIPRK